MSTFTTLRELSDTVFGDTDEKIKELLDKGLPRTGVDNVPLDEDESIDSIYDPILNKMDICLSGYVKRKMSPVDAYCGIMREIVELQLSGRKDAVIDEGLLSGLMYNKCKVYNVLGFYTLLQRMLLSYIPKETYIRFDLNTAKELYGLIGRYWSEEDWYIQYKVGMEIFHTVTNAMGSPSKSSFSLVDIVLICSVYMSKENIPFSEAYETFGMLYDIFAELDGYHLTRSELDVLLDSEINQPSIARKKLMRGFTYDDHTEEMNIKTYCIVTYYESILSCSINSAFGPVRSMAYIYGDILNMVRNVADVVYAYRSPDMVSDEELLRMYKDAQKIVTQNMLYKDSAYRGYLMANGKAFIKFVSRSKFIKNAEGGICSFIESMIPPFNIHAIQSWATGDDNTLSIREVVKDARLDTLFLSSRTMFGHIANNLVMALFDINKWDTVYECFEKLVYDVARYNAYYTNYNMPIWRNGKDDKLYAEECIKEDIGKLASLTGKTYMEVATNAVELFKLDFLTKTEKTITYDRNKFDAVMGYISNSPKYTNGSYTVNVKDSVFYGIMDNEKEISRAVIEQVDYGSSICYINKDNESPLLFYQVEDMGTNMFKYNKGYQWEILCLVTVESALLNGLIDNKTLDKIYERLSKLGFIK